MGPHWGKAGPHGVGPCTCMAHCDREDRWLTHGYLVVEEELALTAYSGVGPHTCTCMAQGGPMAHARVLVERS